MTQIYVVAQDHLGSPVVIGPFSEGITTELYEEIEAWGWQIQSGCARRLTLNQARTEATKCATCGGRLDWADDAWICRKCGDEFSR